MTSPGFASIEPILYLMVVTLGVAAGALSLVAVWAALGRGHWFVRGAAVCGSLALLYPVRAYEPLLIFAMADAAIIAVLLAIRRVVARRATKAAASASDAPCPRLQFRVLDGLLATVLAAAYCALVTAAWKKLYPVNWTEVAVATSCISLLAIFCVCLTMPRGWWQLVAAFGVPVAVGAGGSADVHFQFAWTGLIVLSVLVGSGELTADQQMLLHTIAAVSFCAVIVWNVWLARASGLLVVPWIRATAGRGHTVRWILAASMALILLPLAVLYPYMDRGPQGSEPLLSVPNNLPRINAIGHEFASIPSDWTLGIYIGLGDTDTAERLGARLAEAMEAANGPGYVEQTQVFASWSMVRALLRTLDSEASAAARGGYFDTSAELGQAAIQIGAMLGRGGVVTDSLQGQAMETGGIARIVAVRKRISNAAVRRTLEILESVDRSREAIETTMARDDAWTDRFDGHWPTRFAFAFSAVRGEPTYQVSTLDLYRPVVDLRDARLRLLMVDLAIRLFQSEKGRLPADLNELVPEFLAEVPVDPYAGTPFRYKRQADTFLLYSVGPDCRDDGGNFGKWDDQFSGVPFDLDLDVLSR